MKKMNKKGFTIVELSIAIAVIAILSAVLIPTFSGLVKKSKESAAMQEANHALTAVLVEEDAQLAEGKTYYFISGDYTYKYVGGKLEKTTLSEKTVDADDVVYTKDGNMPSGSDLNVSAVTVKALADVGNVIVWAD